MAPGDRSDRTGQVIGQRFRIDAAIGKGAMADVYRALDLQTSAYVALKILRDPMDGSSSALARFEREGAVQARVRHTNVAALLASGVTPTGEPYLAVELLRGKTLRGVIKAGRVQPLRAASYAWQALQGLAAVHEIGVLHRDLKPANIMLEPSPGPIERVVLIDFGFASFEGSAKLTGKNMIVGSLAYVGPERLRGETVDHRSDLYAIGMILYEMLAGASPFKGMQQLELVEAQLSTIPPPLPSDIHADLADVVIQSVAKRPRDRYPDAIAMARALELAAGKLQG